MTSWPVLNQKKEVLAAVRDQLLHTGKHVYVDLDLYILFFS